MRSNHPMQAGADDLRDLGIGPARGDQLLQHAHIAGGDVVIEIVAGPVPLLRKLERRVAEQRVLPIEQLGVEILEQRQHHPLLGAEVIVDLAQRHAGRRGHVAGRQSGIAVLAQHLLCRFEQRGAGLWLLANARAIPILSFRPHPQSRGRLDPHAILWRFQFRRGGARRVIAPRTSTRSTD